MSLHWRLVLPIALFSTCIISFAVIFLECPSLLHPLFAAPISNDHKFQSSNALHVYIPGAGFSGFFYTLGRLHSLQNRNNVTSNPIDNEYYCFSAGCLALVATLMDVPLHSVVEMALGAREGWRRGEIGRYDVVNDFVDRLLDETRSCNERTHQSSSHDVIHSFVNTNATKQYPHKIHHYLPKIKIITSAWNKHNPTITQRIRTPSSLIELKEMLLQTTWIPFITGPTLGKFDAFGEYHNDGGFAALIYGWKYLFGYADSDVTTGRTRHALKLPWDVELMFHGLNIALDKEKAVHFWNRGILHGIA